MASSVVLKLACALVMCIVVAAPLAEAAVSCGMVTGKLAPCVTYLRGRDGPSPGCCAGIEGLNQAAATTEDRKTACTCLKSAASSISGLDYGKAAALPKDCKVNIPYAISPNTNCDIIH